MLALTLFLIVQADNVPLLKRATDVTSTAAWTGYILYVPCYEWVSPTEVIFYKEDPNDQFHHPVFKFNTASGRSEPLPGLTQTYNKVAPGIGGLSPSPNLKLLLAQRHAEKSVFYLTDIKGLSRGAWPMRRVVSNHHDETQFMSELWTPDSKAVIDSTMDYVEGGVKIDSRLRRVDNLSIEEKLPSATIKGLSQGVLPQSCGNGLRLMTINRHYTFEDRPHTEVTITSWPARDPLKQLRFKVRFPGNPEISEWEFSPDGERIVWMTTTAPTGPSSWIYEEDPKKRPRGPHYLQLWLSRWDGTNQRHLGRIELTPGMEYSDWHKFGWMRFVPTKSAVSFVYKHRLYVLATESRMVVKD